MNFGTNASIMPTYKIRHLDYTDLLNILPGHKKRLLDISCLSIDQILKSIDQLNSNFDTVVLANVDPWFHSDTEEQILIIQNYQTNLCSCKHSNMIIVI